MNGPEHYREAERLVDLAANTIGDTRYSDDQRAQWTAEAQVHATLALAAATAAPQATAYDGDESYTRSRGWAGVA